MRAQSWEISREEMELLNYFRGLPVQQQLDILSMAESRFNSFERMKQLASRQVERHSAEEGYEWH